ncbi:MAG: hypothetical protein VX168_10625 [Pseudomonadota bacterium]|nr:hypothetical protein [bacterium]MEC7539248.1 hypothetical protein [Pseudomonadota bacterium]MEC8062843.1 hypothetical protein [Pseudomonadota bacterium]MEC8135252.1 hypothetical protein [Pseudomonadota bacterium]MEC9217863.1 hypothetical protein [Pseudomonadota bacterium]|tara:strand:+ start:82 stop:447 length:366 start_codon:yes stop_codon:yes gene_type:complete
MAIIEVRTRFTEDAKRKMASVSGTSDRVGAMREIAGEIGLELIAGFYSTSHDEGIAHLSGDPSKIPLLQTILNGSGAYEYARSDILIEGSEMSQLRETAKHIQSKFDAPNRDEIDRMLLEE